MSAIDELLSIASAALICAPLRLPVAPGVGAVGLAALQRMLEKKNGFYAFESAPHVLPAGQAEGVMDLASWNAPELFRQHYGDLVNDYLFFAEDIFGVQFALSPAMRLSCSIRRRATWSRSLRISRAGP
jgi:hypothetical protein